MKIIWLAPHLNHYKARFLSRFAKEKNLDLIVISGLIDRQKGHALEESDKYHFRLIESEVKKRDFGKSLKIINLLVKEAKQGCEWVMIPREKKNIPLLLIFFLQSKLNRQIDSKLISYNHPFFGNRKAGQIESVLLKFIYSLYDRIVFYTEGSASRAIEAAVIKKEKVFWANNTLDESEIRRHYEFVQPNVSAPRILFIGRLIRNKGLPQLIEYFRALKSNLQELEMDIIGDGPMMPFLQERAMEISGIHLHGSENREEVLSNYFRRASMVLIPGHSGLSVNHSMFYGRAYVTEKDGDHAPEIEYLKHGYNGLLLEGDMEEKIQVILDLLQDEERLEKISRNAYDVGKRLSLENWMDQFRNALIN